MKIRCLNFPHLIPASTTLLVLLGICAGSVSGVEIAATWTGAAGDGSYYSAGNWDIGIIPVNDATNTYAVVIPGGMTVNLSEDGMFEITDFSLADSSTLNVGSGSTLTVLDEAMVAGMVTASNGRFAAVNPGAAQLSGTKARLAAANFGTVEIASTSYSSTGLNAYGSTYTLFSASENSVLDLSSVQSIDAGFDDGYGNPYNTVQRIAATTGGHIDLSGLTTVRAPYRGDDKLKFEVGTGSTIDLSNLTTTTTAGSGRTEFVLGENVALALPELTTAQRIDFSYAPGSSVSLPKLATADWGTFAFAAGSSASLPELTALRNGSFTGGEWTFNAPKLTEFSGTNSSVTVSPTARFQSGRDVGGLTAVDNARFAVTGGATWGVGTGDFAATSYSSTGLSAYGSTYTLFSASGNSVLDLSSVQSIDAGFDDGQSGWTTVQRIAASTGGHIDLSGLTTVRAPYRDGNDKLKFEIGSGSTIDLSNVTATTTAANGWTEFVLGENVALALPELTTAQGIYFSYAPGSSVSLAKLATANRGTFAFAAGSSINLPELTTFRDGNFSGGEWTFTAPKLTDFSGPYSSVTVSPTARFQSGRDVGGLTAVNNARFAVTGGATWGVGTGDFAATSYSSTGLSAYGSTYTLFSASGNSVLDLSSVQSIDAGFDDGQSGWTTVQRIAASTGGHIDLSGLTTVRAPYRDGNDKLKFEIGSGSTIDLSNLSATTTAANGLTEFVLGENVALVLPELATADHVYFSYGSGSSVSLPKLASANRGTFAFAAGSSISLPELTTFRDGNFSGGEWTFTAPKLTDFSGPYSSVTVSPTARFQSGRDVGGLTAVNNARFAVAGGATWGVGTGDFAATSYSSTGLSYRGSTYTLFSASGNSVLELSSVQSIDAGFDDGQPDWTTVQRIAASTGGHIDLSGLTTVRAPYRDGNDKLKFEVSDIGSQIDLSGLRAITSAGNGRTEFQINTGGQLLLGDLVQTTNTVFRVQDMSSSLEVSGNLNLSASSELHATALGRVAVTHSFVFAQTDETKINLNQAMLHMNGAGLQYLEVGGEDLGLPGGLGGSGNFGIGQLIIGDVDSPTTVELLDVFDNGNRGGDREALYLYGIGVNEDGLVLHEGSTLVVDHLNAYAWMDGDWVHLNTWLDDGMAPSTKALGGAWMKFDPKAQSVTNLGKVPEPGAAAACLWLLLGVLGLRHRRRFGNRPS